MCHALDVPLLNEQSRISMLDMPTLFVMEGGYAVEEIGINTVNVWMGFDGTKA